MHFEKMIRFLVLLFLLSIFPVTSHANVSVHSLFAECGINPAQGTTPDNRYVAAYIIAYGCSAVSASEKVKTLLASNGIHDQPMLETAMVAIVSGWTSDDDRWMLLRHQLSGISKHEQNRLQKHSNRLLYYILAAEITDPNRLGRFSGELHRLMRKVSIRSVVPFALVYRSVVKHSPDASIRNHISSSLKLLRTIKSHRLKRILSDQAATMMFASLMPIDRSETHDAAGMNHFRFLRLQSKVLKIQLDLFDTILKQTGSVTKAMQVCLLLRPYIIAGTRDGTSRMTIQKYLHQQVQAPVVVSLLGDKRDDLHYEEMRILFARMYAPISATTGLPISYLRGNMGKIANWYREAPDVVKKLMMMDEKADSYSAVIAFLPDIYQRLNRRGKRVFNDLLFRLGERTVNNGIFIAGLFHKTTFFQWVESKGSDAFLSVNLPSGRSVPKYAYILTAPYSINDPVSFIHKFNSGQEVNHAVLMAMTQMSPVQLVNRLVEKKQTVNPSQHKKKEHDWLSTALTIADYADTAFTVVGIVAALAAAPAGGASLAALPILVTKLVAKLGVKKVAKIAIKQSVKAIKQGATKKILNPKRRSARPNGSKDKRPRSRTTYAEEKIYIKAGVAPIMSKVDVVAPTFHRMIPVRKQIFIPKKIKIPKYLDEKLPKNLRGIGKVDNCALMKKGHAPWVLNGGPIRLHHHKQYNVWVNPKSSAMFIELPWYFHHAKKYYAILHKRPKVGAAERIAHKKNMKYYWKARAKELCKSIR